MRIAVIGDVGGHAEELYAALVGLDVAADPQAWAHGGWPDDLHVIQVGDLVDRGPDSSGVLDLVDAAPRDRWTQIVGNHEARYLGGPDFDAPYENVRGRLRAWDHSDRLAAAAHIRFDRPDSAGVSDAVVTHAGLTSTFVANNGGLGQSAQAGVRRLNVAWAARSRNERAILWRPGAMLSGRWGPLADPNAGPLWASSGVEVWPSWELITPPWTQIHGHSSVYIWDKGAWAGKIRHIVHGTGSHHIDEQARHARWRPDPDGGELIGVDPQHLERPARRWAPLIVEGTVTTPGAPPPR